MCLNAHHGVFCYRALAAQHLAHKRAVLIPQQAAERGLAPDGLRSVAKALTPPFLNLFHRHFSMVAIAPRAIALVRSCSACYRIAYEPR